MNTETISIEEYLNRRGILFKRAGKELQTFCLFGNCDIGKKNPAAGHLYLNNENTTYYCQKCSTKGNIFTLAEFFGDDKKTIFLHSPTEVVSPEVLAELDKTVEMNHANLLVNTAAIKWLAGRGLKEETINKFRIGYSNDALSIPHFQDGKVLSIKFRRISEKKYWRSPGTPSILFNTDAIDKDLNFCVVVEGELDCMVGYQEGVKNIVAITVGAKSWKEEWTPFFNNFEKIYLCLDSDTAGQQGAVKIANTLGIDKCFNVVLPKKDLNDFFLKGHTKEELDTLIIQARQFEGARQIISANEILEMEVKEDPFILEKMIVEGSINALTSDSGKGKSLTALKMVEAIARGIKFLGQYKTKKTKVLVMDLEMSENDSIQRVKTIIHTLVEGLDFYSLQSFDIEEEKDFNWLVQKIKVKGYGLIVFDTLSMIHHRNENENTEMVNVSKKFLELTNKFGVTILFLHHHRKQQKGERYNQSTSRGASEIINKVASHLLLDSSSLVVSNGETTSQGLSITIEQFKARQLDRLERFAIHVYHNPFQKKTIFDFAGLQEAKETAMEKAKKLIGELMKKGEEYLVSDISEKTDVGISNIRNALNDLVSRGLVSKRNPQQEEKYLKDKKLRKNSDIFFLKDN